MDCISLQVDLLLGVVGGEEVKITGKLFDSSELLLVSLVPAPVTVFAG